MARISRLSRPPVIGGGGLQGHRFRFQMQDETFRMQQCSCRCGLEKTVWIYQYPFPTGGKTAQIKSEIIWAIGPLQPTITLSLTVRSGCPFVRTFIYMMVWCLHQLRSRSIEWGQFWTVKVGNYGWGLVGFSDFRKYQVRVRISVCDAGGSFTAPI